MLAIRPISRRRPTDACMDAYSRRMTDGQTRLLLQCGAIIAFSATIRDGKGSNALCAQRQCGLNSARRRNCRREAPVSRIAHNDAWIAAALDPASVAIIGASENPEKI